MIKNYVKRKWEWVDKNPRKAARKAAWISWLKGLVTGLLLSLLF